MFQPMILFCRYATVSIASPHKRLSNPASSIMHFADSVRIRSCSLAVAPLYRFAEVYM